MGHKNPTIDITKGIAIILVVYGHVIQHSMAPWGSQDFFSNPVFKIIYTFHMPLFVFISGYLMAHSLSRHSLGDVFKSRCNSLFVPFLALAVLGSAVIYALSMIFGNNATRVSFTDELAGQLFFQPQVWFLLTLFVLSCLVVYSVKLEKHFGAIVFVPIYLLLMAIPFNNYCALYYIKWFYLFYLAGYFFNKYKVRVPDTALKTMDVFFCLFMFSFLVVYWDKNDYIYVNKMNFLSHQYVYEFLRLAYRYVIGFLGITIAFYVGECISKTKASKFFEFIGTYALDIYILQMFIVEGLYPKLIYKENIHLNFNSPLVLFIVAPVISLFFVGICILISKSLIRKSRLLNKLLRGDRS